MVSKVAGAGDGSHCVEKSLTPSEPGGEGKGDCKKFVSPSVGGEKGAGGGVSGESMGCTAESPQMRSESSVVDSSAVDSYSAGGLIQSVARLIKTQTDMLAAQTKVMTAQSLPPLPQFTGEGTLIGDESFDHSV